jgi:choline dehydrogenase
MRNRDTDVVVVGAGAAGCVVAARLSERPNLRVIVLEAGPTFTALDRPPSLLEPAFDWDPDHYWSYEGVTATPQQPRQIFRGRVVGGSGAINGVSVVRGIPDDYDSWGSDLWRWTDVLRAFVRMETDHDYGFADYHGHDGPLPVRRQPSSEWGPLDHAFYEAARHYGFPACDDLNSPDRDGVGPIPRNLIAGRRVDTAVAYLDRASVERANLTVMTGRARRITWEGTRANGVEYQRADGRIETLEAEEVILAAGAIESPHLLFSSGVGAADALRGVGLPVVADLPGVGANLMDHPAYQFRITPAPSASGHQATVGPVTAFATATDSPFVSDTQFFFATLPATQRTDETAVLSWALNREMSTGQLRFVSSDPTESPRVEYQYMEHPADRQRAREGLRAASTMINSPPFAAVVAHVEGQPPDDVLGSDSLLDNWLCQRVETGYHGTGTCRIGPSEDRMAVVDDYCRVHGVTGVRVADLSIAPHTPRGNTFGPAVMIGERASELIAEQLP